jgi:hypothetical protein
MRARHRVPHREHLAAWQVTAFCIALLIGLILTSTIATGGY